MNSWQERVEEILKELESKYELPNGSLYISNNKSQKSSKGIISYSICIYEPTYPPVKNELLGPNKTILTIYPSSFISRPNDLDFVLRESLINLFREYIPADANLLEQTKSDKAAGSVRLRFKDYSSSFVDFIKIITEYSIINYESKVDSFGCCSLYVECSDAKKCLHENKLFSKACMYRNNLEKGKIFYGKNKQ